MLACHILLYTEQNFVENIAEQIASENLFNAVEIERRTGAVVNRNDRKMIMALYEEIHKPFMSVKKMKPSLDKKIFNKKNRSLGRQQSAIDASENYSRSSISHVGTSPNFATENEDRQREKANVVLWKVEHYRKTMDHVKDVEIINKSFKEIMADPHACYTSMKASRDQTQPSIGYSNNTYNNGSTFPSSEICSERMKDDCDVTTTLLDKMGSKFSTTLVSNFGYNPTSAFHTIEEQKKRNNEVVLKLLNNERLDLSFNPFSAGKFTNLARCAFQRHVKFHVKKKLSAVAESPSIMIAEYDKSVWKRKAKVRA